MKKINFMAIVLLCSFGCLYTMDKGQLSGFKKEPVVVHKLTLGDTFKPSLVLSMPVVTVIVGSYAYSYGLSFPMSVACSLGTAISYGAIIKALLCPVNKTQKQQH